MKYMFFCAFHTAQNQDLGDGHLAVTCVKRGREEESFAFALFAFAIFEGLQLGNARLQSRPRGKHGVARSPQAPARYLTQLTSTAGRGTHKSITLPWRRVASSLANSFNEMRSSGPSLRRGRALLT
eukprot:scaffold380_cov272-Pinguiococcus_pyrenoidosus.AAC.18